MGAPFLIGAVVPLLPFVMISSVQTGLVAGMGATALVLFAVGYFIVGRLDDERYPTLAGARFVAIALGAGAAGYLIGVAISPLGAAS
jgi:VIT1/CCC1 family predicted Fe2+/Mn2+ transporter